MDEDRGDWFNPDYKKKRLILIAGAPGSGKSTLAKGLMDSYHPSEISAHWVEADQFFMVDDKYRFDWNRLEEAHEWCRNRVHRWMELKLDIPSVILVSNTFTKQWEREPYLELAKMHGYEVQFIHLTSQYANVHGVPDKVVQRMIENFEPFIN